MHQGFCWRIPFRESPSYRQTRRRAWGSGLVCRGLAALDVTAFLGRDCWKALLGGFRIKTSASRYSNGTHACMCKPTRLSTRCDVCGAHAFTPLVRIRIPTSGSFCLGRHLHPRALGLSPCGACQNGANIKLSSFIFDNRQGFLSILMAWKRLFAMSRHSTIGAAHPL